MSRTYLSELRAWRIGDKRFPTFDGTGAFLCGARWNSPGVRVIYGASTLSLCMLELLVHSSIQTVPDPHQYVEIRSMAPVLVEELSPADIPRWRAANKVASRRFGDRWVAECRTAVLLVPSVVVPTELNVLINPAHPEFSAIHASRARPLKWDDRLFGR